MYSQDHGGHAHMIRKHLGRALREDQRRRWIELLLDALFGALRCPRTDGMTIFRKP